MANIVNGTSTGSGGLITTGDSSDELQLQTAEVARVTLTNTAVVVNESGADVDFRVEGDTDANLLFVDASADAVLIGTNTTTNNLRLNQKLALVNVSTFGGASFTSYGGANSSSPLILDFQKSRGTSDGSMTVVASGDQLGSVVFRGSDGTSFQDAAIIGGEVDGTPGAGDMPGRLVFKTTADGASSATERMRIDSSGNVGIGVTPSAWGQSGTLQAIQIKNTAFAGSGANAYWGSNWFGGGFDKYITSAAASLAVQTGGQHIWYNAPSGTAGNAISFTQAMTLDASGILMVGTTNTDPTFNRVDGLNLRFDGRIYSRGGNWDLGLNTSSGTNISFYTDNGSARVTAGAITSNGATTAYGLGSDYRMKTNVEPMTGALAKVLQLNPVTFVWKEEFAGTNPNGQGFIAHELQEICPDAVVGEKDATEMRQVLVSPAVPATYDDEGNELTPAVEAVYEGHEVPKYQSVDSSFLVATLTAAIQELSAKNDALEARIAALENA